MLRTHHFECPDCGGRFGFTQHLTTEPTPNFCPLCGNSMSGEPSPVFVPAAPYVSHGTIGRTADGVYRQMEEASRGRAEAAAEMAGGDAKDYPTITDMQDYLRPGDVAAKMPNNPVSQLMAQSGQGGFSPMGGFSGADFAAGTSQGLFPYSGEVARRDLVAGHGARVRVVEGLGRMARSK